MTGKILHLNLKYVKPSLLKAPFRQSSKKPSEDDDVPDLASSSCASDQESNSKKRLPVPLESLLRKGSDVDSDACSDIGDGLLDLDENDYFVDDDDDDDDEASTASTQQHNLRESESSTGNVLSAVLTDEEDVDAIATDREQRLVVKNCIPTDIVLLPDHYDIHHDGSESSLEDRLEHAESLIHSYQQTIRSNEHLIESLHNTIAKTQEQALNIISSHKELEQTVEMLLQEREEEEEETEFLPEPKIFVKMAMAISLMLYFFGITTEYPLIATVMVFLLEGLL